MNILRAKWLMAAVAAAGGASAQTLRAEIPFPFHMGSAMMAPGTYRVAAGRSEFATAIIRLNNPDTRKSALVMAITQDAAGSWVAAGQPKISFVFVDGQYFLNNVSTANSRSVLVVPPEGKARRAVPMARVTLDLKAE